MLETLTKRALLEDALRAVLGEEAVSQDEAQRLAHSADLLGAGAPCALVVRPTSVPTTRSAMSPCSTGTMPGCRCTS